MEIEGRIRKTGIGCLIGAGLLFAPALYLHCVSFALRVGLMMAALGAIMGLSLAGATRTRRAALIYLWLAGAFCAGWAFFNALDNVSSEIFHIPRGAASLWESYPVFLRIGMFFLAFPYPFARWGRHAPDVPPESAEESEP